MIIIILMNLTTVDVLSSARIWLSYIYYSHEYSVLLENVTNQPPPNHHNCMANFFSPSTKPIILYCATIKWIQVSLRITPAVLSRAKSNMIVIHPFPRTTELSVDCDNDPRTKYVGLESLFACY